MKTSEVAPVAVFVYNRIEHTKLMLESLDKNELVQISDLYIFSDGPKNKAQSNPVREVRDYLEQYSKRSRFKKVSIISSEKNKGLANSIIQGVTEIIHQYGSIIVIEDDLIVAEDFLKYMNGALEYYENNSEIWSVSGYTPNLPSLKAYHDDVFFGYRASSWGWATWKDRWNAVDWTVSQYQKYRFNPFLRARFCRGGNDLPSMLKAQMNGKINSWAIRFVFQQMLKNKVTVFPRISKVQNNGLDGTGTHSTVNDSNRFSINLISKNETTNFMDIKLDRKLIKEFYQLSKLSIFVRIRDKLKELKRKY